MVVFVPDYRQLYIAAAKTVWISLRYDVNDIIYFIFIYMIPYSHLKNHFKSVTKQSTSVADEFYFCYTFPNYEENEGEHI